MVGVSGLTAMRLAPIIATPAARYGRMRVDESAGDEAATPCRPAIEVVVMATPLLGVEYDTRHSAVTDVT